MRLPHWLHQDILASPGTMACRVCGRQRAAGVWPRWQRVPLHMALGIYYRFPPCCIAFFIWSAEVRNQMPAALYGVTSKGCVPCPLHRRTLRRQQATILFPTETTLITKRPEKVEKR